MAIPRDFLPFPKALAFAHRSGVRQMDLTTTVRPVAGRPLVRLGFILAAQAVASNGWDEWSCIPALLSNSQSNLLCNIAFRSMK